MNFSARLAAQLASPQGLAGRLLGVAMDHFNRNPTRLALDRLCAQPHERVLDAGCGTGAALAALLSSLDCEAIGLDSSPTMCAAARARLKDRARIELATIEKPPFPPASFDAALALNVLYFADVQGRLVGALRRLLKADGRLVAYVTHRNSMSDWGFARAGLHRLFDERELTDALVAGGFVREAIRVHSSPIAPGIIGLVAVAWNRGRPSVRIA